MQRLSPSDIETLTSETEEWVEALNDIHREHGEEGVLNILRALQNHVLTKGISLGEATLNTPYVNTIPLSEQPPYPGNYANRKRKQSTKSN